MIGNLYIVATPIGHLNDISKRALDVLQQVDFIACEDTRHSQRLLQFYGIDKSLLALHQHNERGSAEYLVQKLLAGKHIALVSDAGTPLVSDPGAILTLLAHEHQIKVIPVPGASSVMTALSASGLSADQFVFAGFIPAKAGERQHFLTPFNEEARTSVFFETPHRIKATLSDMQAIFDNQRVLVIARELTKQFEEICRIQIADALTWLAKNPYREKGEFVLMLEGVQTTNVDNLAWQTMADGFIAEDIPTKSVVTILAKHFGVKKKVVYQYMIDAKNDKSR